MMGIKTNTHNEIADALTKKLNEVKVDQLLTQYKIDNPDLSDEEYEKKKAELYQEYNLD